MNLVLIGYRGTGKSAVGELLARRLGMTLVNMDEAIVEKAGMRIPEIVEKQGWTHFRDLESEVARDLSGRDGLIIDTGGGVIERDENVATLKRNGVVFWLTAPVDVIVTRIEDGTERPALTDGKSFTDEVAEVLERRNPLYEAAAHHVVATEAGTPDEIAAAVIEIWQSNADVA